MNVARKISKEYYLKQIVICWLVFWMGFGLPAQIAMATPLNPDVVAGTAGVGQSGNTTTVNMGSARAVINWDSLDTSSNEILQFIKAGGSFAVLNRVISGGATQYNGSLFGNQGHIIIVNTRGIIFGPTALVQAYKFTASALDIKNTDFMNGIYNFAGGGIGEVANYGRISAEQVALIGKRVLNAGTISAPDGFVIMAAGDKVFIGNEGGDVVVEVAGVTVPQEPPMEGMGDVINEGTIDAAGGKIVLAAGDTFSRAIEGLEGLTVAVDGGIGRVGQFGTLNADGVDGDGGSITLTAGEVVALGEESVTTANAGENGDGGDVIVYSPDTALFREGAVIEAKGGSVSGDGGFVELSGKQHVDVFGNMDLSASAGRDGLFLLDPYNLTIVAGDSLINLDDGGVWTPTGTGSQVGIEKLEEFLGTTDVTLSTFGSGGEDGDITFAGGELNSGVTTLPGTTTIVDADNSLIVRAYDDIIFEEGSWINFKGDGDVKLYAGVDWVISVEDTLAGSGTGSVTSGNRGHSAKDIWTQRGDIIIDAGSSDDLINLGVGIDMGTLLTGSPSLTDDAETPGEIRLSTINGGDITVEHLGILGKRYGSVYVKSSGDLAINGGPNFDGAVHVKTNTSSVSNPSSSFVCLIADGDVDIVGKVFAEAHGKGQSVAGVWIGAGDPSGAVTIDGVVQADASSSGSVKLKEDATVRIYGNPINLPTSSSKTPMATTGSISYQGDTTGYDDSGVDDTVYAVDPEEPDSHGNTPIYDTLVSGSRAVVDIDVEKDGSCLNCANEQILILFDVADNEYDVDWRAGYTIEGLDFVDLAQLGILDNDDPEAQSATANIIILSAANGTLFLDTSGPYPQLKYMPPSYDEDFEWDGSGQFATFEDVFTYQVEITVDGQIFISQNFATVTITVQNEVPTLLGADDTIHMNTSADFDLSGLVTDNDGTPGVIESFIVTGDGDGIADNTYTAEGTAGALTYGIVQGTIPLDVGGSIATDDSRLIPYYNGVAPLTIADSTITYTPLDGYVSPDETPTTFGYTVSDDNIKQDSETAVFELPEDEDLEVTVTNELPSGDGWLGKTPMDTPKGPTGLVEGGFVDNFDAVQTEADDVSVVGTPFSGAKYLTGDSGSPYGGELTYDKDTDTWTYTPDTEGTENLLGYTGDDNTDGLDDLWGDDDYQADEKFVVQLSDGQNRYELEGDILSAGKVTNDGTVSVDLESGAELSGDGYLGLVHMDTTVTTTTGLTDTGTLDVDDVVAGTYAGTSYAGATLEYDEGTGQWTYTPAGSQTGYTGDSTDNWNLIGTGGYNPDIHPDEKFIVDLSTGENDYSITGNTVMNDTVGFLVMDGGAPVKELVTSDGSVTVELSNVGPSATGGVETEHMATPGNMFTIDFGNAQDNEDTLTDFPGQTVLDDITVLLEGGTDNIETNKGMIELVDNYDGTFSFTYTPKEGATGTDTFNFTVSDGELGVDPQEATLTVTLENALPGGEAGLTTHMDTPIENGSISGGFIDDDSDSITIGDITASNIGYNKTFGGDLEYNGSPEDNGTASEWDYDPDAALSGYVGEDDFDVELWDGEYDYIMVEGAAPEGYEFVSAGEGYSVYRAKEYGAGTVSVDLTNTLPSGSGDLGQTPQDTILSVSQELPPTDTTDPVFVLDPEPDTLSIVQAITPDHYTGSAGGTLEFVGNQWIYTPASGHTGTEEFTVQVWDGEYDYTFGPEPESYTRTENFGSGTVTVTVPAPAAPLPVQHVAPLGVLEYPQIEGCPVLMQAVAAELGVPEETIQVAIGNALAVNPNIQACDACARLVDAAAVLRDTDGNNMSAMVQVFNDLASADAPFTEEMAASIATAFADNINNPEMPQYATAMEYIDAFVEYIAVLDIEFGSPVGDSVAFVMEKYGTAIDESDNPNISTYLAAQLATLGD